MHYANLPGMTEVHEFRGDPRTSDDWAALAKMASGHTALTREELRRLFMLGLVERRLGYVCLTQHGRTKLGLPS